MGEKTLYERLGGVFAIAAVVDRFSDEIIEVMGAFAAHKGEVNEGYMQK